MKFKSVFLILVAAAFSACGQSPESSQNPIQNESGEWKQESGWPFSENDLIQDLRSKQQCVAADSAQRELVIAGNALRDSFMTYCLSNTGNSAWCQQIVRPNPKSRNYFVCTYGNDLPHQLISPDQETWIYPIQAIQMIQKLSEMKIQTCEIYNWWRPEPYNKNVEGEPGRHPFGTAIDVRFCSKRDQHSAFLQLCKWRKEGRIRAIGFYPSTAIHFGIGDVEATTWGKACPELF